MLASRCLVVLSLPNSLCFESSRPRPPTPHHHHLTFLVIPALRFVNHIAGTQPEGALAIKNDAKALLRRAQSTTSPAPDDNKGARLTLARAKMEKNELEGRLAQVNADLSTERDARLTATREKDEATAKASGLERQLQPARAALLRLTQEKQSLFTDVQTARAENEKLRTEKDGLETQWAEREVPPDDDLRQENIDQRVTIEDLQSRLSELMNAEEELNDNLEAEANDALKDALEVARHEAALAKQVVETLTGQARVLEADLKASEEESDRQFRELKQAMSRSSRLEGLNAETEGRLVMTQKELTKAHSQLEKLELQLQNMSADHYARVTEDAEQLRELRSELRKQPSPAHAAFRSQMLSKFLGIYLLLIKPAQWTTILESLDDEQVPGQGMEPWTFVSSTKSLDEPLPTVEATCLAILAAAPESREYC